MTNTAIHKRDHLDANSRYIRPYVHFDLILEMAYTCKRVTACRSHVSVTTYMYIVYHTFKTSETTLLCSELPVVQKSELGNLTRVNVLTAADTAIFWSPELPGATRSVHAVPTGPVQPTTIIDNGFN
jgi:hypothetical protein